MKAMRHGGKYIGTLRESIGKPEAYIRSLRKTKNSIRKSIGKLKKITGKPTTESSDKTHLAEHMSQDNKTFTVRS